MAGQVAVLCALNQASTAAMFVIDQRSFSNVGLDKVAAAGAALLGLQAADAAIPARNEAAFLPALWTRRPPVLSCLDKAMGGRSGQAI
jgi:hypothetical protein